MGYAEAIEQLQEHLSFALDAKIEQNGQALSLVDRASLVDALVAVSGFLYSADGLRRFHFQFNELASALADLDRGAQHPILRPKRIGGRRRPPDPTDLLCAQGRVAFAIEMLVRARMYGQETDRAGSNKRPGPGRPRSGESTRATIIKDCAQTVANRFPCLRHLVSKGARSQTLAGSIKYWHSKFYDDQVENPEARDMYLDLKEKLKEMEESDAFSPANLEYFAFEHLRATSKVTESRKKSQECLGQELDENSGHPILE